MAQITVDPLFLTDVVISVDGDSYEKAVSGVTFTPSVTTATFKGLNPAAVYSASGSATWMVQLDYVQDWETADSLSAYLFNNQGEEIAVTFKPRSGTGPTVSGTIIVVSGSIGGTVDSYATASVQLPMIGQPTITPAA